MALGMKLKPDDIQLDFGLNSWQRAELQLIDHSDNPIHSVQQTLRHHKQSIP